MKNGRKIDKTAAAEEVLRCTEALYLEGAASCGKTTLIEMLCEKHPDIHAEWFRTEQGAGHPQAFVRSLESRRAGRTSAAGENRLLIFDNLPADLPAETAEALADLVRGLPQGSRVIFSGRQKPCSAFVKLLWEGKMEILPQRALLFDREEVRGLVHMYFSEGQADPDALYELTGGWPGCVCLMLRLASHEASDWRMLRGSYEVSSYITKEICGSLTGLQQELLQLAALCPWISEALCREADLVQTDAAGESAADADDAYRCPEQTGLQGDRPEWKSRLLNEELEDLSRMGFLIREPERGRFRIAPLFADEFALRGSNLRHRLLKKCFFVAPLTGLQYQDAVDRQDFSPEACYLRGMQCLRDPDPEGLAAEISRIRLQMETILQGDRQASSDLHLCAEVYLNLAFASPAYSLEAWLKLLQETAEACAPCGDAVFHLYGTDGVLCSCLCGLRDLSGLFSGSGELQNSRMDIWRRYLGETEWTFYRLAKLEYALDLMEEARWEDEMLLLNIARDEAFSTTLQERFSVRRPGVPVLILLCRMQQREQDPEREELIAALEKRLYEKNLPYINDRTEAAVSLYAPWCGRPQRLTQWLKRMEGQPSGAGCAAPKDVVLFCMAKGYLMIGQYEKAGKAAEELLPLLSAGNRSRHLAEVQFMLAVSAWEAGNKAAAVRYAASSFLTTGESRYISFYAEYGTTGVGVLRAYLEWIGDPAGTGFTAKKPYAYSSASRMPQNEYLEKVLYCANRQQFTRDPVPEEMGQIAPERLTMMETAVLQDLGQGMSNARICEEHGLKLSTVKTHLSNIYRKLGVKNRAEAVLKGRELGLLIR